MRIVAVQLDLAWEDRAANLEKVRAMLRAADVRPRSLIVLPEMYTGGYTMNVDAIDEGEDRPGEALLAEVARRYESYVIGGVVRRDPSGRGRNEAVTMDPAGREVARYTKMHPMMISGEIDHYVRGERTVSFDCFEARVAPAICYDLRFADVFHAGARAGAQVFAVIANFPSVRGSHWVALLRGRAIEYQAYVVGVNRCGRDPHHEYPGRSQIVDPWGEVLADAGDAEGVIAAEIDLERQAAYRRELPVLDELLRGGC